MIGGGGGGLVVVVCVDGLGPGALGGSND